jgi:tetraacyldisaccharide 4'-kinase
MNLLTPFGKLYGRVMDVRNRLYDRGAFRSYDLGARTISVGNLTTGGTGKTPLVALIAKLLIDDGEAVCILTRGYGRVHPRSRVLVSDGKNVLADAATGGDEPVELAMKLEGKAIIVADPDRVAAAKWARENFSLTTFILDDGFQHRRARRDLDIVCIDATNPCGNGRVIPAGTLRESFRNLNRADAIVITRTELVEETNSLQARLRNKNQKAPIFLATTQIVGFIPLEEFHGERVEIRSSIGSAFVFTAIGSSEGFIRTLARSGVDIRGNQTFRDHHHFTQRDIDGVERRAGDHGPAALVTTAKDAVKLRGLKFGFPVYVAIAETIIEDPEAFRNLVISS